ncbi:hypothetical protein MRX96_008260 [Rhipicephalus microplus]
MAPFTASADNRWTGRQSDVEYAGNHFGSYGFHGAAQISWLQESPKAVAGFLVAALMSDSQQRPVEPFRNLSQGRQKRRRRARNTRALVVLAHGGEGALKVAYLVQGSSLGSASKQNGASRMRRLNRSHSWSRTCWLCHLRTDGNR